MRSEIGVPDIRPEGVPSQDFLWLALLTVLGAVLRFYHLDSQSLWLDESYSVFVSGHSPGEIFSFQVQDSSPPLYYLMLHYWMRLWGHSEFAVRSLSAISGILLIPFSAMLSRRVFTETPSRFVPLLTAVFVAVSPVQIYFSQETRMYSTGALLAVVAVLGFLKAADKTGGGWVFIPAAAALNWLHNYGWFIWLGLILWSLYRPRKLWIHHGIIGVLSLPWLISALSQVPSNTTAWVPRPGMEALWKSLLCFAGKFQFYTGAGKSVWAMPVVAVILIIMVMAGILGTRRQVRNKHTWFWILALPLAVPLLISQIKPIYYPERHEFIFHTFVLVFASGVGLFLRRKWVLILPFIFVLAQVGLLGKYYSPGYSKSNDRVAAETISGLEPGPSDLILSTDLTATPLRYYLENPQAQILAFPRGMPGWLSDAYLRGDPVLVNAEIQWIKGVIETDPVRSRVIVAVAGRLAGDKMLTDWLDTTMRLETAIPVPAPRQFNQVREVRVYGGR